MITNDTSSQKAVSGSLQLRSYQEAKITKNTLLFTLCAFKTLEPLASQQGGFETSLRFPSSGLVPPTNKPFSAPHLDFSVCLDSLCVKRTDLGSTTLGSVSEHAD